MAALVGVLGSGPVNGVLIGAAMSIVAASPAGRRAARRELGLVPGTSYFADRSRHPENERDRQRARGPVRIGARYFNVEFVRERLVGILADHPDGVRLVVFFLGSVPVSISPAPSPAWLHRMFAPQGIAFRLAEARGEVRDALRRIGFEEVYGVLESGQTVDVVVRQWRESPNSGHLPPRDENRRSEDTKP